MNRSALQNHLSNTNNQTRGNDNENFINKKPSIMLCFHVCGL